MDGFIVVGNMNAVIYKEVFPLFKDCKVRLGYTNPYFEELRGNGLTRWFVTFPVQKKPLVLSKTYTPEDYPTYDNYPAIEVGRIKDIPYDYEGVMGVPIGIFDYDLENVEIIGEANDKRYDEEWVIRGTPTYIDKKHYDYQGMVVNGKPTYARVLIRRKDNVV